MQNYHCYAFACSFLFLVHAESGAILSYFWHVVQPSYKSYRIVPLIQSLCKMTAIQNSWKYFQRQTLILEDLPPAPLTLSLGEMSNFVEFTGLWYFTCLVPRPQYYVSVIRFGSRGPGRKVWPRQKSEKWDNLSHFFTEPISSRRRNSLRIFGRGTAREKHFKLLVFGLMLIGQVKRPIWIQTDIYRVRNIAAFKLQANTDYSKYSSFNYM